LALTALLQFWPFTVDTNNSLPYLKSHGIFLEAREEIIIGENAPKAGQRDASCTFHTCFDVYHCGYNDDNRISIYVYPFTKYVDEKGIPLTLPLSKEYIELMETIMDSIYYESDPDKACLFLPSVDFLNQNSLRLGETSQILAALPRYVLHLQ
jgi:glucuronyl/N-acetylglucosaminyl transferase EXT2